jgi:hypothetical protein
MALGFQKPEEANEEGRNTGRLPPHAGGMGDETTSNCIPNTLAPAGAREVPRRAGQSLLTHIMFFPGVENLRLAMRSIYNQDNPQTATRSRSMPTGHVKYH